MSAALLREDVLCLVRARGPSTNSEASGGGGRAGWQRRKLCCVHVRSVGVAGCHAVRGSEERDERPKAVDQTGVVAEKPHRTLCLRRGVQVELALHDLVAAPGCAAVPRAAEPDTGCQ